MKVQFIKQVLLNIFLILGPFHANNMYAQDPVYYTIGAEELANVDVYSLLYDDETDLLYAGTNRGVYRYSQNKFTALNSHKNQNGNSFFQLQKDKNGRIFCCNLSGQIFQINDSELSLFYEYPKREKEFRFFFSFDAKNNIIAIGSNSIRKILPSGEEVILCNLDAVKKNHPLKFKNSIIRSPPVELQGKLFIPVTNSLYYLILEKNKLLIEKYPDQLSAPIAAFLKVNDIVICGRNQNTYRLDGKKMPFDIPYKINTKLEKFNENLFIVENNTNGIHLLEAYENGTYQTTELFQNQFISSEYYNKAHTLFLGTFKNGIIVVPNWKVIKHTANLIYSDIATSPNNEIYVSTRDGQIFINELKELYINDSTTNIDNIHYIKGKYKYVKNMLLEKILFDPSNQKNSGLATVKNIKEVNKDMLILNHGFRIAFVTKEALSDINESFAIKDQDNVYRLNVKENRFKSVGFLEKDSTLFFSTNFGLYMQKWNTNSTSEIQYNSTQIDANSLDDFENQLIIGTENSGILFFKNGDILKRITLKNGLISNTILKIKVKNDLLFILTKDAMQVYDLKASKFLSNTLLRIEGNNHIISFALSDDRLWLLDKNGYYSVKIHDLKKNRVMPMGGIYLDSILSNGIKTDMTKVGNFPQNQQEIQFFFDYRDVETKAETQFWYKLKGVSSDWKIIKSTANSLIFPILPIGKYTFLIKAKYQHQETEVLTYDFKILPPFWRTWWFLVLFILMIILTVSLLFFMRIKRIQRLRRIEIENQKLLTDMLDSQLKAIRSQMNPHFIFNSLNSIQALVLRQDTEKSYDYIVMFSNLVRKTLRFSELDYIHISEEIDFLTIYLQLESLRMKESFKYSIDFNEPDPILIPSLLVQPFLENAIHHGLLHKRGQKDLTIQFNYSETTANCIIIDNGIGRKKAKEIKERQSAANTSFSLKATEQRLQILTKQNNRHYFYTIEDLVDSNGTAIGTKVVVNFPFKHNY